ncbi:RhuM family protein [Legionella drancourtii]|uniref:Virulence RhuM family protein n=1 Tax=Legionella drancourtii LLAP12 TaxID=658187 RepID=G9EQH4_9GAMM|nr:hypothetical protein LDG_7521 [Legionella drancourtii LLAP12]
MRQRVIEYDKLDAIIAYRVNSIRNTQFRIWTTQRLRECIIKDYIVMSRALTLFS